MILPVDEAVPFRRGGWIFPELFFLIELPSEFVRQRSPSFLEVWGEHFMGVAPVEELFHEVSCGRNELISSAVLNPISMEGSKDEAFKNPSGVSRGGRKVEIQVHWLHISCCANGAICL